MLPFTGTIAWGLFSLSAVLASPQCVSNTPDGPLHITAHCMDPIYNTPIIARETDEITPVPHRRVAGYFNDTTAEFTIYLPLKDEWKGRFFQLVYPLQGPTAEDKTIAFGIASGAYTVRAATGGGYRGDAAVAKLSRQIAREFYGISNPAETNHIYGYIYGGSGGSMQTIGALENTVGVWDGGIALVQGVPMSIPNNFCIRALAGLVLGEKADLVADAVSPGGSGDPFSGLEDHESLVLEEVTALGLPLLGWEDFEGLAGNRTKHLEMFRTVVIANVKRADPGYVDDFWNKDGYLGKEDSKLGQFFRDRLVDFEATVVEVDRGMDGVPVRVKLSHLPEHTPNELEFTILSHVERQETRSDVGSFTGVINKEDQSVFIYSDNNATILASLEKNTPLRADNRWNLALHAWHRHQLPPIQGGYYGYNHLRKENGEPRYPQRDILLAPSMSRPAAGGGTHTGKITGKLMVIDNLADYDAFAWHADWYRTQVQSALGEKFQNNYRLYFNEHADHGMGPPAQDQEHRLVDITGHYDQLLRDLSAWVERDSQPPRGTRYTVENGQVKVAAKASQRAGIQPVVSLTVRGGNQTEIRVGEQLLFVLKAEVPPGTGSIVSVEWDPSGTGDFVRVDVGKPRPKLTARMRYAFEEPGTYFPVVRVTSHRDGDVDTSFARVMNLGRVRVVVH
ncbi:hypothetical protein BJX68DRAFT_278510 [Aspergillus pseudodeflectus]|uniref:Tat pathway signal sequence domain protein n=1 Tax=Aspergillus pseudodeflectus TaxID=176178 RepID=A0ABR4JPL9_9EURO